MNVSGKVSVFLNNNAVIASQEWSVTGKINLQNSLFV